MMKILIKKTEQNQYFIFTILSCLIVIFWYLNFSFWHLIIVNFLFLIIYFFINAVSLGKILAKILNLEKEFKIAFGLLMLIFLIGFLMAIPIVFYRLPKIYLFVVLFFLPIIISFLNNLPYFKKDEKERNLFSTRLSGQGGGDGQEEKTSKLFYLIFFLTGFFCLFLLFRARTGEFIKTPWINIHPLYLVAWLLLIFLFVLIIFKKLSFKKFLIILIFVSIIAHLFLIIPYEIGFGGDKWRHLGAEKWIAEGKIYSPALFGENISYKQIGFLKIPEVFLVGNKTSYSNFWGTNIAFSQLLGVNLFYLDLVLGILLFSIFLPFLMLKLGTFISQKKEFLYLFAFSPLLFSPFLIYGSITVPLSFAFLPFLFSLIFLFKYLKGEKSLGWLFASFLFLVPLLYLNYILYLTIFFALFSLSFFVKKTSETKGLSRTLFLIGLLFVILSLSFFFVFLDTAQDYSWFDYSKNPQEVIISLKDFSKKFLTSTAIFPRPNEMEQDNWLYATTQSELSRSIVLKILPWNLFLTPAVLILAAFGILSIKKMKTPLIGLTLFLCFFVLLVNQFVSSYFMEGNYLFAKRLVLFFSFLFAFFVSWGIYFLVIKKMSKLFSKKAIIFALAILLSLISTTVYASGPKFQTVTKDELSSAQYLWDILKKAEPRSELGSTTGEKGAPCVLANTWPLLALEAVSAHEVVAGGFPVYYEYKQPERVFLFENMNKTPSVSYLDRAIKITGSSKCFFVTEERFILFKDRERIKNGIKEILGEPINIGKVLIWIYEPNK